MSKKHFYIIVALVWMAVAVFDSIGSVPIMLRVGKSKIILPADKTNLMLFEAKNVLGSFVGSAGSNSLCVLALYTVNPYAGLATGIVAGGGTRYAVRKNITKKRDQLLHDAFLAYFIEHGYLPKDAKSIRKDQFLDLRKGIIDGELVGTGPIYQN